MSKLLSDTEILRYNRQISLLGFDFDGQERLKQSTVLVIGLGGLGCAATQYLAAGGIGKLLLVDFDHVTLSNLQRQILHHDTDIGKLKTESARESLKQLNPSIQLTCFSTQLSTNELLALASSADIILDCSDNLATREQLNQIAFMSKKPLISGSAIRMEGQLGFFGYQAEEACYQCFSQYIARSSPSCAESGVLSPLVGIIGNIQALEAMKYLAQYGSRLLNELLIFDAMTLEFHRIKINKNANCPICRL